MRRKKKKKGGGAGVQMSEGKGWDCALSGTVCKDGQVGFPVPLYFYVQLCPWMQSQSQSTSVVGLCVHVCVCVCVYLCAMKDFVLFIHALLFSVLFASCLISKN